MGYLICEKCGGYYELQEGETIHDFQGCSCGGKFRYAENLDNLNLEENKNENNDLKSDKNSKNEINNLMSKLILSIFVFFAFMVFLGYIITISNPKSYGTSALLITQFIISFILVYVLIESKESIIRCLIIGFTAYIPYLIIMYFVTIPFEIRVQEAVIFLIISSILGAIVAMFIKRKSNGRLEEKFFTRFSLIVSPEKENNSFKNSKNNAVYTRYKSRFFYLVVIFLVVFTISGTVVGYSPIYFASNTHDYDTLFNFLENGNKKEQLDVLDLIVLKKWGVGSLFPMESYDKKIVGILENKAKSSDLDIRYAAVNCLFIYIDSDYRNSILETLNYTAKYDSNSYVRNTAQKIIDLDYDMKNNW